jgi:predicted deacylase
MHRLRVVMTENATGNESLVPVVVVRTEEPGPVVGITAAIHGNELNGIPVIHRLLESLVNLIRGTVIAVPIVNIPGYLRLQREFEDGQDLNRIMPGEPHGNAGRLYAYRFIDRIAHHFEYLLDLHTASAGRANSLYIRADMTRPITARLARITSPQIIVHNASGDGTMRGALEARGAHAITIEVGDPQQFQDGLVRAARLGIQEVLEHLKMLPDLEDPDEGTPIECRSSYWMYTDRGGIMECNVPLVQMVKAGDVVARLRNVWGDVVREYLAPDDAVVIGKSTNPTARAGSRIVHLGIVGALDDEPVD